MISDLRLEVIVRNLLMDGLDAGKIARKTGVPPERVQQVIHRIRGRDPAQANRETRKYHRKERRRNGGWR
jgi:hypothetical protein